MNLKTQSIRSVLWATSESAGVALLSFVSFIVMARMLDPRDFGVVALAGVFVYFFNLLMGHSFADALVQRQRLDDEHLDTAFWSTLAIALTLFVACQIGAGALATLLGEPALASVLRWMSLVLPLGALSAVPLALYRRNMRFDTVAIRMLVGRSCGAAVGISMALSGFGLWSLVAQQVVGTLITTLAVVVGPWRPRLRFSIPHLRDMWSFGFHVTTTQIVTGAGEQLLNLLIGTLFGTTALGYFNVAWRMVQLIRSLIASAVYYVGLSAFAKLQGDRPAVTSAFVQSTRISCLIGFPIAAGIALVGGPLVLALFGDKWVASIPLLSVLALEMIPAFYGIFLSALYRAMDRAAWGLAMAALYLAAGLVVVLAAAPMGLLAVAVLWVARAVVLMPVHVALVRRLLGANVSRLLRPIVAPLAATAVMAACVAGLRLGLAAYHLAPAGELAILVSTGALVYAAVIWLLSPDLAGMAIRTACVMAAPNRKSS